MSEEKKPVLTFDQILEKSITNMLLIKKEQIAKDDFLKTLIPALKQSLTLELSPTRIVVKEAMKILLKEVLQLAAERAKLHVQDNILDNAVDGYSIYQEGSKGTMRITVDRDSILDLEKLFI